MRKKKSLRFVCSKCGFEPSGKLDGNWKVVENKPCEKCGGVLTLEVDGVLIGVEK
jgi:ribosomal protein S27AE